MPTPAFGCKCRPTSRAGQTKVIAQKNDGTLEWSAAGILTPFLDMRTWTATQMVQPMDDYVAASKQEGAATILSDMIPTVKEDASFEGKVYCIPYSFENITFNWRIDYANAVGATEAPETWDDWLRIALELKKWGAEEKIYPTAFAGDMWTDVGALICSAIDKPYTDDGMIDWMCGRRAGGAGLLQADDRHRGADPAARLRRLAGCLL